MDVLEFGALGLQSRVCGLSTRILGPLRVHTGNIHTYIYIYVYSRYTRIPGSRRGFGFPL